jgi:hypothetical protein
LGSYSDAGQPYAPINWHFRELASRPGGSTENAAQNEKSPTYLVSYVRVVRRWRHHRRGRRRLRSRAGRLSGRQPTYPASSREHAADATASACGREPAAATASSRQPTASGSAAFDGAIIACLILTLASWRSAFLVARLATMALGALAWWCLRDDPANHPGVNSAELRVIKAQASLSAPWPPSIAMLNHGAAYLGTPQRVGPLPDW